MLQTPILEGVSREASYTSCGIDALLVVCSYAGGGDCFYPSGPCEVGKHNRETQQRAEVMECVGSSGLGAHLRSERATRLTPQPDLFLPDVHGALSVAVESLCKMVTFQYNERSQRDRLYIDTLATIRAMVGAEFRLTTMPVSCAWCNKDMGDKEGNGSTGESSTICPDCYAANVKGMVTGILETAGVEYTINVVPATVEGVTELWPAFPDSFKKDIKNLTRRDK